MHFWLSQLPSPLWKIKAEESFQLLDFFLFFLFFLQVDLMPRVIFDAHLTFGTIVSTIGRWEPNKRLVHWETPTLKSDTFSILISKREIIGTLTIFDTKWLQFFVFIFHHKRFCFGQNHKKRSQSEPLGSMRTLGFPLEHWMDLHFFEVDAISFFVIQPNQICTHSPLQWMSCRFQVSLM